MRNVFMDLSINGGPAKRLVFQLDITYPQASENFRALCIWDRGIGQKTGKRLHYKGTKFFSIFEHLGMMGGDIEKNNGTGGESIYGGKFPSEGIWGRGTSGRGVLLTVTQGSYREIGSQFLLCFKQDQFLEGSGLPFGRVIDGMETLSELERLKQYARVVITDCGAHGAEPSEPQSSSGFKLSVGPNEPQSSSGFKLSVGPNEPQSSSDKRELPASNPDEGSESRKRSKKSESAISEDKHNKVTESDKELETKVSRLQHDLTRMMSDPGEMNAEISELKQTVEELRNRIHELERKRSKSNLPGRNRIRK